MLNTHKFVKVLVVNGSWKYWCVLAKLASLEICILKLVQYFHSYTKPLMNFRSVIYVLILKKYAYINIFSFKIIILVLILNSIQVY